LGRGLQVLRRVGAGRPPLEYTPGIGLAQLEGKDVEEAGPGLVYVDLAFAESTLQELGARVQLIGCPALVALDSSRPIPPVNLWSRVLLAHSIF
jgi:hypothetical protein